MDDDVDGDADLLAALRHVEHDVSRPTPAPTSPSATTAAKVQQPKPQALPSRRGPSSILVSPRQKGNPILKAIQSVPWEYSDIPADYVVGATSCVLFLSLKYHRLHPEYIYSRIRALAGRYKLRVLLTMVDIENHEDPLKELSKTSLINHLTLLLCWSAAEAGRYLSLLKTYEHTSPSSIRAHQPTSYNEKLVDFITTPRTINKTDAISLVGNFGSLKAAIDASPDEISMIGGWGEKKVNNWCLSVRETFRVRKAKKRGVGISREPTRDDSSREAMPERPSSPEQIPDADKRPPRRPAEDLSPWEPDQDDEEAMRAVAEQSGRQQSQHDSASTAIQSKTSKEKEEAVLGEGVVAALARLREAG